MPRIDWTYPEKVTIREAATLVELRDVIWIDTDTCQLEQYATEPNGKYWNYFAGPDGRIRSYIRKFESCKINRTTDRVIILLAGLEDGINRPGT